MITPQVSANPVKATIATAGEKAARPPVATIAAMTTSVGNAIRRSVCSTASTSIVILPSSSPLRIAATVSCGSSSARSNSLVRRREATSSVTAWLEIRSR
jgi:hypothetical protein